MSLVRLNVLISYFSGWAARVPSEPHAGRTEVSPTSVVGERPAFRSLACEMWHGHKSVGSVRTAPTAVAPSGAN